MELAMKNALKLDLQLADTKTGTRVREVMENLFGDKWPDYQIVHLITGVGYHPTIPSIWHIMRVALQV